LLGWAEKGCGQIGILERKRFIESEMKGFRI
jgi:hypothetical protein